MQTTHILLAALAVAGSAEAFSPSAALPMGLSRSAASKSTVQMGLMSTADFPVYAPKVLGSRRLARLINSKCVVAEQSRLSEELEESISAGEKALASGDKTVALASLESATMTLAKLGMTPTTKIGLTSLPGRAYELQRQLV